MATIEMTLHIKTKSGFKVTRQSFSNADIHEIKKLAGTLFNADDNIVTVYVAEKYHRGLYSTELVLEKDPVTLKCWQRYNASENSPA